MRALQGFAITVISLAFTSISVGCSQGEDAGSEVGRSGTLELPLLAATPTGEVFKLTGSFHIAGASELDVSADDDELELRLPVGAYSIRLNDDWILSRQLPSGDYEPVAASVKSANPAPFNIYHLESTTVRFHFEAGEVDISLGRGDLNLVIDVDDGLIDDFEDGDELVLRIGGRDGAWYTFNDETGSQTPSSGGPALPELLDPEPGYALHTSGDGFTDWGAGLGASSTASGLPYDASGYVGIRFRYQSSTAVRFEFDTLATVPPPQGECLGACFDGHGVTLPAAESWQTAAFAWDELAQRDFGDPAEFSPEEILAFKWLFEPPSFDFELDDVEFVDAWPADPAVAGAWGEVIQTPVIPIHAHLLPNRNVLFWTTGYGAPVLFDPEAGSFADSSLEGVEVFCSGHSFLADGRLLVTGGQANGINELGLDTAYAYDPDDDSWTELAAMNAGRWYPTNVTLGDGRVLVASGTIAPGVINELPQVYDPDADAWQDLTDASRNWSLYPMMHLAPNGLVFHTGPESQTFFVDVTGSGSIIDGPARGAAHNDYGNSVVYDQGKILVVGGGDPPRAEAEVIDLNQTTPEWRSVAPMNFPRRQHNAVILPDGKVLVTGGSSGPTFNNLAGAVLEAELWDPDTETWDVLAPQLVPRLYHSTSVLLADGRVMSGGGGFPAADNGGSDNFSLEIFSPPYLFQGPRPVVTTAPVRARWDQTVRVLTPDASRIARVNLIRHTSVTHSTNMDQRLARATFTVAGGGTRLNVRIPSDPNLVPPGPYLLFLVDSEGVPSEGQVMMIGE